MCYMVVVGRVLLAACCRLWLCIAGCVSLIAICYSWLRCLLMRVAVCCRLSLFVIVPCLLYEVVAVVVALS